MSDLEDLLRAARAWADDDPDPVTHAELERLATAAQGGDTAAHAELADAMSGMLEFGTAGLRGRLGGGPHRMNRAVVIRAAAGLTAYLQTLDAEPFVVVGFDARTNSDVFAHDTCAVVTGMGGRAVVLPHPLPTPVLAYAIRYLGADAGVMVTASHNPPEDNGYKVYVGDGSQIVPPVDGQIAERIAAVGSVASVPRADDGWETLGDEVLEAYLADAVTVLAPGSPRDVTVVHTALHGVGSETVRRAFAAAGFPEPVPVPSQAEPDPMFPTVSFPNPEEPGAMDAALELAEQTGPDVVVANDPDADRCAVAVPGPGGWRMLRGDEVGVLLGSHVLSRGVVPDSAEAVFASSIVSSRMLAAMCRAAGVRHEETLTGFKWIGRVPGLRYGYEEALGYCVDPAHVRDKDGVTAALLVAEMVATLAAEGRSLLDRLDDLAGEHGVHATDSFAVRVEDLGLIGRVMDRLRAQPPAQVAGVAVERVDDLARGDGGLPPTEGLRWYLTDGSRVIVRPSGTEPKLKVYLEVVEPVAGGDLRSARERAAARLAAVRTDLEAATRP
ncbi:phospho-sugar mutase [Phycicoccus endophyticus]|uniref:Phospho-sugar mutase n=1 Tax=Phycicoccus endophyticus TaxID=1690220 RepID=A0A7G9R2X5_9MICO|nr:phospho-sugar mutase [Phycicoccus endophyticus]NHI20238.1 phospho-sugar mutase [Phycicoccus endophyticus]QNN49950.1 phospho-sugar mutase [Phycicoccus endophyticus]GGL29345.1 phosphomannomutase [Phycicoccus endophyticus]